MISLTEAASALQDFEKGDLGERIGAMEAILKGADASRLEAAFPHLGSGNRLLEAALTLKAPAGQVNVLIHAIGILLAIPKILSQGEQVISRNNRLWAEFQRRYGARFSTVSDYYTYRKSQVSIKDLTSVIPMLSQPPPSDEEEESI